MLSLKPSKVVGNPDATGWVQVHDFTPDDKEKLKLRGRLIATISFKNKTKTQQAVIENVSQGREVLARLHEEYYGSTEQSIFNALSLATNRVFEEFQKVGLSVEIAACVFIKDPKPTLFVAAIGGAAVKIVRSGSLTTLLESREGVFSASGYPKTGDVVILGTKCFFKHINEASLKSASVSTEDLAANIHANNRSSVMGAAIISFSSDAKDEFQVQKTSASRRIEENLPDGGEEVKIKRLEKQRVGVAAFIKKLEEKIPKRSSRLKKDLPLVDEQKNRKVVITVGVLLLFVLGVSIFFGIRQKKLKDYKAGYESRLDQALHEFEQSQNLIGVNRERSRELFVSARNSADELLAEGISDPKLDDLKQQIDSAQGNVLGEYTQEASLFVDLSLISDAFSGTDMASSEDVVYVFDKESKRVIEVEITTKGSKVVAGPGEIDDGSKEIAVYSSRVFLMDNNGIDEVKEGKVVDEKWGSGSAPYAYAGNLYVLDRLGDDILRFSATTSGFSDGNTWLAPGIELDLSDVASWSIDGSVWLLFSDGRILKLLNGAQASYSQSGIFPKLTSADVVYTNEELGNIYILDKENKRIVVTDKEGEYVAQYLNDEYSGVTDFAVSEKEKKIILLSGDKLLAIEIKH